MPGQLVIQTLKQVWTTLEPLGLSHAVIGGIALSAWEYVRSTLDVDIMIGMEQTDPDELLTVLQKAGLRPIHHPAVLTVGPSRFLQVLYQVPGTYQDIRVDLLFADSEFHKQALGRRVALRLEGMDRDISVVSCEDLILLKLIAGRIRDRGDVISLLEANRGTIDFAYLTGWVPRLAVVSEWRDAWQSAFPGEPVPGDA